MPPPFQVDDLSDDELEQIRRFIEEGDELSDEMHALVEKYWPWILALILSLSDPEASQARRLVATA